MARLSLLAAERNNSIMATVTPFMSTFGLFTSRLYPLGFMNSDE